MSPLGTEVCLLDILSAPEATLKRALPRVSTRMLARLVNAYPRVAGRTFLALLTDVMSAPTLHFLKDEIYSTGVPTMREIYQAEAELMKLVREETNHPEELQLAA
jgi:hypothetical protein